MKFEFNSDGFDGLLDDLKTFELTEIAMITFFLLCNIYTPFSR